jgi:DNA-binding NtrC family response regulator
MDYRYPGNIRELRNIVEYCVNICQSQRIEVEHLPKYLFARKPEIEPRPRPLPQPELPPLAASTAGKDWQAIEKDLIIETLTQTRGNRTKAAEILGWGRTTLWRKLKLHGLVNQAEEGRGKN